MRPFLPLVLLVACDTTFPRLNPDADVPGSVLSGTIYLEDTTASGPTLLLLSEEANPMPPLGVGFPVTFSGTPPTAFGPPGAIQQGAPYAFTDVPPGGWFLLAVHDTDRNFHPGVLALSTPSCGDHTGWHVDDFTSRTPTPVQVGVNDFVSDVAVGPLALLSTPDPACTVPGDRTLVTNTSVRFEAVAVDAAFGDLTLEIPAFGSAGDCTAGFAFVREDADGNGSADASSLLPLIEERWPRFVFTWLGAPIDTDDDGVVDDFDRGNVDPDVTIAAIGDPAPADGPLPAPGEMVITDALDVRFTGFGQRIEPDGTSTVLAGTDLPSGAWGVNIISQQGQLWFLPNELDARMQISKDLPPPGLTRGSDPSQGVWFSYGE